MIYGGILVTTQSPKVNCGAVDGKPLKPALDMGLCGFRIIPTEEFRFITWAENMHTLNQPPPPVQQARTSPR